MAQVETTLVLNGLARSAFHMAQLIDKISMAKLPFRSSVLLGNMCCAEPCKKSIFVLTSNVDADPTSIPQLVNPTIRLEFAVLQVHGSGRRVMGIAQNALASKVHTQPYLIWDVPDNWSLQDAATAPVAYATAYYSLVMRGRLRSGMSVLIHSGSGAVGLAAIQICLHRACKVNSRYLHCGKHQLLFNWSGTIYHAPAFCFSESLHCVSPTHSPLHNSASALLFLRKICST